MAPPKRRLDASESSNKRQRTYRRGNKPAPNHSHGQRSAFPGLDDNASDAGSASANHLPEDPIAYLRRVRSQANSIPSLLTSSAPHQRDSGLIYGGDAIVAAPFIGPTRPPTALESPYRTGLDGQNDEEVERGLESNQGSEMSISDDETGQPSAPTTQQPSMITAQAAHHKHLLNSYRRIQSHLSRSYPHDHASTLNEQPRHTWYGSILFADPSPAILSHLDQAAALTAVSALTHSLKWKDLTSDKKTAARLQAWTWGLLARLDIREMGYEDVGCVRSLGKKALTLLEHPPSTLQSTLQREKEEASQVFQGLMKDHESMEAYEKWQAGFTPFQKKIWDMNKALRIAIKSVEPRAWDRNIQIIKWAMLSGGLMELCEKIQKLGGDVSELSDDDKAAWEATVEAAVQDMEEKKKKQRVNDDRVETDNSGTNDTTLQRMVTHARIALEEAKEVDDASSVTELDQDSTEREGRLASAFATLDMILTIVGEIFGQRDLLSEKGGLDVIWVEPPSA